VETAKLSRDYWFISDTHFFHENIIRYCGRPFSCAEEMNDVLVDNWNSLVRPGDIVYHLGDVYMGATEDEFKHFWPRLNGSKRLIVGNHDDIPFLSRGGFFKKVKMWKVWDDRPIIFTHVPIHESSIHERVLDAGGINVHGHTHNNGSPKGPYKCICVELTGYKPVNLEELLS
jgi:calcineurin-like phosphoesterase family protein